MSNSDGYFFRSPALEITSCFVMCGKAICRKHGCLRVYEVECERENQCTCPEAGQDPGCPLHGLTSGDLDIGA